MIQWATVLFYFSVEEVLISSVFPSMGVQKSLMLGFSYFTEGALLIFALHPLWEKSKKRKIKLFLNIYLLRFSPFPGKVNVPSDFDTIEKAFFGVKTAEKGIEQGLSRSNTDFERPCLLYSVVHFDRSKSRRHRGV